MYLHGHLLPNVKFSASPHLGATTAVHCWGQSGRTTSGQIFVNPGIVSHSVVAEKLGCMDCVWHMHLKSTTFLSWPITFNKKFVQCPCFSSWGVFNCRGKRTFPLQPQIMGDAQSQLGHGPETWRANFLKCPICKQKKDLYGPKFYGTKPNICYTCSYDFNWFYIVSNSPEYQGWDAYWLEPKIAK